MEDSNAEKLYQEAIRLCKNGKFKESSKIFFQIIKHKNSFGCLQKMCDIVIKNPENNSIEKSKAYAYKGGLFCKYKNDLVRGYYNFLEAIKLDSNNFKAFENLKNIFSEIEKKGIEVTLKLKTEKDFLIHKNNILFLIGLYSNLSFLKTECQNNFLSSLFSHRGYLSFNYDNDFDSALKDVKNALEYNKNNVLAKTILNQLQQKYHLDISLDFNLENQTLLDSTFDYIKNPKKWTLKNESETIYKKSLERSKPIKNQRCRYIDTLDSKNTKEPKKSWPNIDFEELEGFYKNQPNPQSTSNPKEENQYSFF